MLLVLLARANHQTVTNRNPVTNETILDGWAESTSHDTECVTGTPCPTSVKNISFVTEWLRLGRAVHTGT